MSETLSKDYGLLTSYDPRMIVVVPDRYGGCYSGGKWLAFRAGDLLNYFDENSDLHPCGSDHAALYAYWDTDRKNSAAGSTPLEAIERLLVK